MDSQRDRFFFPSSHFLFLEHWKPINPEEKKRYDREFLLGFQFISASMHKPEGLPHITDVVLEKVHAPVFVTPPHHSAWCLLFFFLAQCPSYSF